VSLSPRQIPHDLTWDRTWGAAVGLKFLRVIRRDQSLLASWLAMNDQASGSVSSPAKVSRPHPSSGWKNNPGKKPEWGRQQLSLGI
jgi:hypothetical protein